MKKNLNLQNEQILGRTLLGNVLFTDKRIKVDQGNGKELSIGLERIDTISSKVTHINILLPVSILCAMAAIYFVVYDRFIYAGSAIIGTVISYALYLWSKKRVLSIKFDSHSYLNINVANLEVDINTLIGSLSAARFHFNHDQYRSRDAVKIPTSPIKISA